MEVIPITLSHFFWNNIQANSKDYFSFFLFFFCLSTTTRSGQNKTNPILITK